MHFGSPSDPSQTAAAEAKSRCIYSILKPSVGFRLGFGSRFLEKKLSSAQLSSARLGSAQLSSAQLNSAQLSSASAQLSSASASAQLSLSQFGLFGLNSAQERQVSIFRVVSWISLFLSSI